MKNKHNTKKRVMAALCIMCIMLPILCIPTFAVITVSRGEGTDYVLSAQSTFPMTVGFSYKSSPNSTYNYTLATDIGGYGQEWNKTLYGEDVVMYEYDELGQQQSVTRRIDYEFGDGTYTTNNTYITAINGNRTGYLPITLKSSTNGVNQETSSVTISATDIVYNLGWLDFYEASGQSVNLSTLGYANIPTIKAPELSSADKAIVGRVSISYLVTDAYFNTESVSFSYTIDTRQNNDAKYMLSVANLLSYDVNKNPRLLISNYNLFWDVDYYEKDATDNSWDIVNDDIVNEIQLTLPIYDTSGAYHNDNAQTSAQEIYFSFPNTSSYVNNVDRLSLEEMDLTSWLATATKGFLDFELWRGFSIGGLLSIIVAIPLVIWILKIFAGG